MTTNPVDALTAQEVGQVGDLAMRLAHDLDAALDDLEIDHGKRRRPT